MKKLWLLALLILLLSGCALPFLPAAPEPTAEPTSDPTPEPTMEPTASPAPAVPAAMAADGVHPQLIAHAGGAVYGYRLTNSLEALDSAYEAGFRFIELDFSRTEDGRIVLLHDWEAMSLRLIGKKGPMDAEDFLSAEALAGLTLLDAEELIRWLEAHPDCNVILDTKEDDAPGLAAELCRLAGPAAEQLIPQAYSFEEADELLAMGCERVILTLYRIGVSAEELRGFVEAHSLWAVTMSDARITPELAAAVADSGTALYCHTVNSLDFIDLWRDEGLTGVYTDYFQPVHWAKLPFPDIS